MRGGAAAAVLAAIAVPSAGSAQGSASSFTSGTRYDLMHRVVGTIAADPDGSGPLHHLAVRTTYDAAGNVVLVERGELAAWQSEAVAPKDWSGFTVFSRVESAYDVMDRKVRETLWSGSTAYGVTQYGYDVMGRLECAAVRMNPAAWGSLPASACSPGAEGSDGPDRITRTTYTATGQVAKVQRGYGTPLQQDYATYEYTANDKQKAMTDANGNRATMSYDGVDRQAIWMLPNGRYERYGYDANSNRTSLTKRDGQVLTYTYDALNRMTVKTVPTACTAPFTYDCINAPAWATRSVYYAYDLRGLQTAARFDSASGADAVLSGYDGFGRLTSSTTAMAGTSRTLAYAYDADGNRVALTHGDGSGFTYAYDGLDREVQGFTTAGGQYNLKGYDAAGRLASDYGGAVAYGYDAVGRLATQAIQDLTGQGNAVTATFGYNPAGQLASMTRSNDAYAFGGYVAVSRSYAVNGLNQYTSAGPATFAYDTNGNLTGDGTSGYGYDAENRLVTASNGTSLTYDPLGRLWQVAGAAGTTRFLYDGDRLAAEYDGAGTLLRRYAHGTGEDTPAVWFEGAGLGDPRYLFADRQGSIVAVFEPALGRTVVNAYDEYGIPDARNTGRFQYTGQAWLPELGMYHYKARLYSPTLGRFLQTDPIGYADQNNLYAYVANDPVNNTDPTGTECQSNGSGCPDIVVTARKVAHAIGVAISTPLTGHVSLPAPVLRAASAVGISQGCAESLDIGDCSTGEKIAGLGAASLIIAVPELVAAFSPEGLSTSIAFTTAKGSITNITADVSIKQVAKTLISSGFRRTVSQDGRAIVFEKGGVRYSYYASARSTGGPSLLRSVNGSSTTKIRLNP